MPDAWSLFRSIGKALGAYDSYLENENMKYALYRAYGPDWENRLRQEREEHQMAMSLDRALLDNRRQDLETERWNTHLREQEATSKALENAMLAGGRTAGKYTPATIGVPGSERYEDLGQLAWDESERLRKAKQRWLEREKQMELEQKREAASAETARQQWRDVEEVAIEKYKTTPGYLDDRYKDRTDYEAEQAAQARHQPPGQPAEKESVTERVARKLALANQILLEDPSLDDIQRRPLDEDWMEADPQKAGSGAYNEVYEKTGRPVPYKKWDDVPYHIQQEVERRLTRSQGTELGTKDPEATPEPEKEMGETYRIPVSLRIKIDSGEELTPEEIEYLRSLRR